MRPAAGPDRTTRRGFLAGSAAVGGLAVAGLASCTGSRRHASSPVTSARPSAGLAAVQLVTSLENLAVETYESVADGATRGAYGSMPTALTAFVTTVRQHHRDHADHWNSGLTAIGSTPVTGVDATFRSLELETALDKAKTASDLARVLLYLEGVMAATYLDTIDTRLQSPDAMKIAVTIHPVEMQHAAVLEFLIGNYPVPDSFATNVGARPVSDQIA